MEGLRERRGVSPHIYVQLPANLFPRLGRDRVLLPLQGSASKPQNGRPADVAARPANEHGGPPEDHKGQGRVRSPGADKEANWLPAPDGPIYLVMRLYRPKDTPRSILPVGQGAWRPPGVSRLPL
jgi:hypothetical protein